MVHANPRDRVRPAQPLSPVVLGGHEAGPDANRWGRLMASALGGALVDGPDAAACDPASVDATSLVIVSLPQVPGQRAVEEHVVALARTCTVPVLFVPTPAATPRDTAAAPAHA